MTFQLRFVEGSIRSRIWLLTGLACATLAALALLLAWSIALDQAANGWVIRAQAIRNALSSYTGEITEAETGQRGYLLTGQAGYLAPYNAVLADNEGRLERVRALITDRTEQRKLERVAEIFKRKLSELARTIQLAQAGRVTAALALVRGGSGLRYTQEFERLSGEIEASETAELARRQAAAKKEDTNIWLGAALGGILAVLMIVGAAARTISRIDGPLRDLLRGIAALSDGDPDARVPVHSHDEIGRVAAAFNVMIENRAEIAAIRDRVVAELAGTNRNLITEVEQRSAAQKRLTQSMVELRRSNEELDNFAYAASHDLKAPLRGIRNLTDWIAADVEQSAGAETIENLALLRQRVERLDLLLDSLLQYSRVGRAAGTTEDIDIAQLVHDIGDYIAPRAGFTVTYSGDVPTIRTHKAPLEQTLRNLISNALKHHDGTSGTVDVSARDQGSAIEFRVQDDGPGIPASFHERVFQMFQTLKSRDEVEGSGMGLAIVKKAVESRGGSIRIESAPPQRGAAFIFTWEKERLALAA